jgi:poly(A) polymerase
MKILALPGAARAAEAMAETGVLQEIWAAPASIKTLGRLKHLNPDAAAPLGLAALWGRQGEGVDGRLRLSSADGQRRRRAIELAPAIEARLSDQAIRALIYRFGSGAIRDALMLAEASAQEDAERKFERHKALTESFSPPERPFSGLDVLAEGVREGPQVAAVLAAAEARWISEDFPPSARGKAILAEEIARLSATS